MSHEELQPANDGQVTSENDNHEKTVPTMPNIPAYILAPHTEALRRDVTVSPETAAAQKQLMPLRTGDPKEDKARFLALSVAVVNVREQMPEEPVNQVVFEAIPNSLAAEGTVIDVIKASNSPLSPFLNKPKQS